MTPLLRKFLGINWVLFALMVLLAVFGIYAIYSATWMRDDDFWQKQSIWLGVSMVVFFVTALVDYRWVRWGALPLYVVSLLGLVAVQMFGKRVYGAKSWLDLGFMNFQPSQLAIVAGIMVLAFFLSQTRKMNSLLRIGFSGAIVGAPWILILIQPDLGSALVWIPVIFGLLFIAGIQLRYLLSILILGVAMIPLIVFFGLKDYQRDRITTFMNPDIDPQGIGWTINQSLTAIGSGGWEGKGFMAKNTLNELGFLPSTIVHNDFIFSVIGEQHGFLGGSILIGAFALLIVIGVFIALNAEDELGRLVATGITMMLFAHVFMNIGMTIALTPITGLPLPLVSYGGSFALVTVFSLGLLQSIWIHRKFTR